jgi:RNA polymerase sigma-70 factor (ECF subfamily)
MVMVACIHQFRYLQSALVASANQVDVELVRSVADGDRDALGALYDRYAPSLMAVGARILGDRRELEDLVHDVFLEVWRQAADYDARRGSVRAWLLMRMRSRALDRRKAPSRARVVSLESPQVEEPRALEALFSPDHRTLRMALTELPDEQRLVLELGYFEGLSSSEIATRLEVPIGTVKSRVAAALGRLRRALRCAEQES